MKANEERHSSPMASFLEGLNSSVVPPQAPLNGIGRTARALKQISAVALAILIVPMTSGDLLAQAASAPASQPQTASQQYQNAPPSAQEGQNPAQDQTAPPQENQGPPPAQGQYQGAPPPPPSQNGEYQDQSAPQQGQYQSAPPQQYQGAPPPQQGEMEQNAPPAYPGAPQGQPLSPEELNRMVAPIALYPDALVAQVLAASTYPSEVVEADRWLQAQGNRPPEQIAAAANAQNWDPSVKALVAFPSVLAQMDRNIQWTTDLGNAYYNQPDAVMSAVQAMRQRAQAAGTLRTTPQQVVTDQDGDIIIAPANPEVVYVPTYNPWVVYGAPFGYFPGYYYGPAAGVYFGTGLAIGFGVGIGIGIYSHWGWGYHNWHPDWRNRTILYNHGRYYTHSRTVYNRSYNRSAGARYAGRGAYNRGGYNRAGAYRGGNRGAESRPAERNYNRGGGEQRGGHEGGFHGGGGGHEGGGHGHR